MHIVRTLTWFSQKLNYYGLRPETRWKEIYGNYVTEKLALTVLPIVSNPLSGGDLVSPASEASWKTLNIWLDLLNCCSSPCVSFLLESRTWPSRVLLLIRISDQREKDNWVSWKLPDDLKGESTIFEADGVSRSLDKTWSCCPARSNGVQTSSKKHGTVTPLGICSRQKQ